MRQAKLLRLTAIILSEDEDYCQRNHCSITFLKLAYPLVMSTGQFQLYRYSLKFHLEFCFCLYSTDHYSVRTSYPQHPTRLLCTFCMHITFYRCFNTATIHKKKKIFRRVHVNFYQILNKKNKIISSPLLHLPRRLLFSIYLYFCCVEMTFLAEVCTFFLV